MTKSPRVESTDAPSPTSPQQTLLGMGSGTSSPASADGPTPSGELESPTPPTSGRGRAPASRSRTRARGAERATLDIFGQHGSHSSASVALQSSLENRLRARMASRGSTLFTLTWNDAVTPSGRRICALRASVRHTSGSDCTSWPTPTAHPKPYRPEGADLPTVAGRATLATPAARDWKSSASNQHGINDRPLNEQARLAHWATPVATEIGNTLENYVAMKRNARSGPRTAITHPSIQAELAIPGGDCDWILCRDGVSRPVEPGTFPLVAGVPGRVGLLRGYGNAITTEVAVQFILACMEATA